MAVIEPFGDERLDWNAARICQAAARDGELDDWRLKWDGRREMDEDEMEFRCRMIAAQHRHR